MSQIAWPFPPHQQEIETKMDRAFYRLIARIDSEQEAREVFGFILTRTEKVNLPKRLAIFSLLQEGERLRWEDIAAILHVSLATINKISDKFHIGIPESFMGQLEIVKEQLSGVDKFHNP